MKMTEYEKRLKKAIEKIPETIDPEEKKDLTRDWLIKEFGCDRGIAIYEILFGKYRGY